MIQYAGGTIDTIESYYKLQQEKLKKSDDEKRILLSLQLKNRQPPTNIKGSAVSISWLFDTICNFHIPSLISVYYVVNSCDMYKECKAFL